MHTILMTVLPVMLAVTNHVIAQSIPPKMRAEITMQFADKAYALNVVQHFLTKLGDGAVVNEASGFVPITLLEHEYLSARYTATYTISGTVSKQATYGAVYDFDDDWLATLPEATLRIFVKTGDRALLREPDLIH